VGEASNVTGSEVAFEDQPAAAFGLHLAAAVRKGFLSNNPGCL